MTNFCRLPPESDRADDRQRPDLSDERSRTEDRDHDGAEDPSDPVHGENVQRVVNAQLALDQPAGLLAQNACDRADDQRLDRTDKARRRGNGGEAGDGAGDQTDEAWLAEFDPLDG